MVKNFRELLVSGSRGNEELMSFSQCSLHTLLF